MLWYSLETPQWGTSNEYSKYMFCGEEQSYVNNPFYLGMGKSSRNLQYGKSIFPILKITCFPLVYRKNNLPNTKFSVNTENYHPCTCILQYEMILYFPQQAGF